MHMKMKTKIIIVLFVLLYIGLIIVVRTAENNNSGISDKYKGLMGKVKRQYSLEVDFEKVINENKNLFESPNEADLAIDLNMFKQGEEFRFGEMLWNISLEKVKDIVSYSLREESVGTQSSSGYVYYVSEDKHTLYGQMASAIFVFYEDQLKSVQFDFTSAENPRALFDSIVEALVDICGEESEHFENESTGAVDYKWYAENTVLQVSCDDSDVVISVGLTEAP